MGVQRGRKWDIPTNIDPPGERCITLRIPDDDEWENMLYSAIYNELAMWIAYARDEGKNGTRVASRWREALRTWRDDFCPVPSQPDGEDLEEMSILREDCNCNIFAKCCDGSEKQIATVDMLNRSGQPGPGTPQPAPGGGNVTTCISVPANGIRLLPIPVSTGDVISLASSQGATNDPSGPGGLLWWCDSGNQYFGGVCQSFFQMVGTDPLPSAKHMALIINIAGTFYDLTAGPVTVPGGVSNYQPTLQVNDSTLSDNNGDLQVCVNVVNNQAVSYTHVFDFTINSAPGIWSVSDYSPCVPAPAGHWTGGVGYDSDVLDCSGEYGRLVQIESSVHVTTSRITVFVEQVYGTTAPGNNAFVLTINGSKVIQVLSNNTINPVYVWTPGSPMAVTSIEAYVQSGEQATPGDPGGQATLPKIIVEGPGTDPY